MQGLNFIAIDFETANSSRASICEAGICVVRDGKVQETRSWLVRPQGNVYNYWNIKLHGIRPNDTENSPEFPEVWTEISKYLQTIPVLVAHNAMFDMGCIRCSLELYGMEKPEVSYYCSLRAARRLYDFHRFSLDSSTNDLKYLMGNTIAPAMMRRCVLDCSCGKSGMQAGVTQKR